MENLPNQTSNSQEPIYHLGLPEPKPGTTEKPKLPPKPKQADHVNKSSRFSEAHTPLIKDVTQEVSDVALPVIKNNPLSGANSQATLNAHHIKQTATTSVSQLGLFEDDETSDMEIRELEPPKTDGSEYDIPQLKTQLKLQVANKFRGLVNDLTQSELEGMKPSNPVLATKIAKEKFNKMTPQQKEDALTSATEKGLKSIEEQIKEQQLELNQVVSTLHREKAKLAKGQRKLETLRRGWSPRFIKANKIAAQLGVVEEQQRIVDIQQKKFEVQQKNIKMLTSKYNQLAGGQFLRDWLIQARQAKLAQSEGLSRIDRLEKMGHYNHLSIADNHQAAERARNLVKDLFEVRMDVLNSKLGDKNSMRYRTAHIELERMDIEISEQALQKAAAEMYETFKKDPGAEWAALLKAQFNKEGALKKRKAENNALTRVVISAMRPLTEIENPMLTTLPTDGSELSSVIDNQADHLMKLAEEFPDMVLRSVDVENETPLNKQAIAAMFLADKYGRQRELTEKFEKSYPDIRQYGRWNEWALQHLMKHAMEHPEKVLSKEELDKIDPENMRYKQGIAVMHLADKYDRPELLKEFGKAYPDWSKIKK